MASHTGQDICDRTFEFAVRIVGFSQRLDEAGGVPRILGRQLLRAGTSIGANVEEAQAGQSRADFQSKIDIALKEARETRYWLRLLATCSILTTDELDSVAREATEIARILGAISASTRRRTPLGSLFTFLLSHFAFR